MKCEEIDSRIGRITMSSRNPWINSIQDLQGTFSLIADTMRGLNNAITDAISRIECLELQVASLEISVDTMNGHDPTEECDD